MEKKYREINESLFKLLQEAPHLIYEEEGKFYAEDSIIEGYREYLKYLNDSDPTFERMSKLHQELMDCLFEKEKEKIHPLKRILRLFSK